MLLVEGGQWLLAQATALKVDEGRKSALVLALAEFGLVSSLSSVLVFE